MTLCRMTLRRMTLCRMTLHRKSHLISLSKLQSLCQKPLCWKPKPIYSRWPKINLSCQNYLWRFLPIVIGWKYTIGKFWRVDRLCWKSKFLFETFDKVMASKIIFMVFDKLIFDKLSNPRINQLILYTLLNNLKETVNNILLTEFFLFNQIGFFHSESFSNL